MLSPINQVSKPECHRQFVQDLPGFGNGECKVMNGLVAPFTQMCDLL